MNPFGDRRRYVKMVRTGSAHLPSRAAPVPSRHRRLKARYLVENVDLLIKSNGRVSSPNYGCLNSDVRAACISNTYRDMCWWKPDYGDYRR